MDGILHTSTHYPANYGFIPRTYCEDFDPVDVLVLSSESIQPLSLCRCYPIGMVSMLDEGFVDNKIVAILQRSQLEQLQKHRRAPPHIMQEICHFFTVYKSLEDKHTAIIKIEPRDVAIRTIGRGIQWYKDKILPFCPNADGKCTK